MNAHRYFIFKWSHFSYRLLLSNFVRVILNHISETNGITRNYYIKLSNTEKQRKFTSSVTHCVNLFNININNKSCFYFIWKRRSKFNHIVHTSFFIVLYACPTLPFEFQFDKIFC